MTSLEKDKTIILLSMQNNKMETRMRTSDLRRIEAVAEEEEVEAVENSEEGETITEGEEEIIKTDLESSETLLKSV